MSYESSKNFILLRLAFYHYLQCFVLGAFQTRHEILSTDTISTFRMGRAVVPKPVNTLRIYLISDYDVSDTYYLFSRHLRDA